MRNIGAPRAKDSTKERGNSVTLVADFPRGRLSLEGLSFMDRMIETGAISTGATTDGTGVASKIRVSIVAAPDIEPSVAIGVHDVLWAVGTLWNRVMGEAEAPRF